MSEPPKKRGPVLVEIDAPTRAPIPVAAAAHYHMGGVESDRDGRSSLPSRVREDMLELLRAAVDGGTDRLRTLGVPAVDLG